MRKFLSAALFGLMLTAMPAYAADWRGDQSVTVAGSEKISQNLYVGGKNVSVEGETDGDACLVGLHTTLTGAVRDDVAMVGMTVSVTGPVGGDLRLVGRDVTVGSTVGGEAVVIGSSVQVLGTASIAGDLIVYAEEVTVNGTIGGKVSLHAKRIVLNGHFLGGAELEAAEDMKIGDAAVIDGAVSYRNPKPVIFPAGVPEAKYLGAMTVAEGAKTGTREKRSGFGDWVMSLAMAIVAGLAFFLISRRTLKALADGGEERFWARCGLAFLILVALPLSLVMLIVTLIGIPVAMLGLLAYVALCFVAWALVGTMAGLLITHRVPKLAHRPFDWMTVVGGTVALYVVKAVPVLGGLTYCIMFLAAQGVIVLVVWRALTGRFGRR